MQAGFQRCAIGFAGVALNAGANNILPRRRAAAVSRNHVIEVQVFAVKHVAAVLAGVSIPLEDIMARELDFLFWQPVEHHQ